ncbi:MAG: sigma 54-interacting transcriptional regulator [Rhodothermaceae bacterium]|nr:sigma 54-interacting transcriptional regulator [Rhodothermaceae bacterium]
MDRQAFQERFGLLGDSAALRRVMDRVRQVAPAGITVLLEGESGVGKELIATAVHELSKRRHRPMVVVNCGAIPEGLIESELFGAEKGAYTGATERRTGYFEDADNGTVFLDEIGELPLAAQVRLLRVLESGQFSRVGSSQTLSSDVRVIAATNKDLAAEVRAGRFREDLYYRLSAIILRIPALRERREDIVPIFEHYLHRYGQQYNAARLRLTASARELLRRYNWPGNVRELRNVAEQAVVLIRTDEITAEALRPLLRGVSASAGLALASKEPPSGSSRELELIYRALLELRMEMRELRAALWQRTGQPEQRPSEYGPPEPGSTLPVPTSAPTFESSSFEHALARDLGGAFEVPEEGSAFSDEPEVVDGGEVPFEALFAQADADVADADFEIEDEDNEMARALERGSTLPTMEEAERLLIVEALRRFDGNRRQTAEALGISERTLYRKIKDLEAAGVDV